MLTVFANGQYYAYQTEVKPISPIAERQEISISLSFIVSKVALRSRRSRILMAPAEKVI